MGAFAEAAPAYGASGLYVGPLCWPVAGVCACGGRHTGNNIGKAPLTSNGFHGFTTDAGQIAAWAVQYPDANIGIDLGRSGLVVIDPDSEEAMAEVDALGYAPTATVVTGKGRHHYFRLPNGCPVTRATGRGTSTGRSSG